MIFVENVEQTEKTRKVIFRYKKPGKSRKDKAQSLLFVLYFQLDYLVSFITVSEKKVSIIQIFMVYD